MASLTTILASDRVSDSRAVINTNFTNLNTDKAEISGALTQFVGNGNWKVFYSDGSGDIIELALGASGTVLQSNGAAAAPTFEVVSGGTVGPGTINELAYFDTTTSIASLAVATYPSLTEVSYVKGVTSAIQTQINAKAPSTSPTFATSVTGSYLTASEILITDGSKNIVSAAVATYPSLTELTYVKGVTSAIQTQLNAKAATLSGTINEIAYFDSSSTIASLAVATYPSLTELSYVKGVTSAIQTQLGTKAPSTSPTFATSITGSYLTASEIVITDGSKNLVSAAVATYPSLTELTYVKGVTSAIQTQINTKANSSGSLTQFVGNTAWSVFYSDGSGDIIELALGADGTFLKSNGAAAAPTFATPAGSGDVSKVGTPLDNQIGVWTGDGTIEGDADLTFDTVTNTLATVDLSLSNDLLLASGSIINFNSGDVNLTHSLNTLTIDGGIFNANADMGLRFGGTLHIWNGSDNSEATIANTGGTGATILVITATDTRLSAAGTDASSVVTVGGTQTLTNKTLTSPTLTSPALGTPASGTVTNLTGTASININGTVGATTPTTGVFTTLVAGSTTSLLLGTAGSAVGNIGFRNATSGTITLAPVTGALGTVTLTLPAVTDTLVTLAATQSLSNKTITSASLSGTQLLAEGASIGLDPSASADGAYSGITITATSGYAQAFGDLVYLDPTDSRWEAVDANAASGADGDARGILGMVVVAGTDGNACTILLQGVIRADANFPALTINAPVYASETAGDIVVTQPTTTDVVIRVVGFALTADSIYFNPSSDFITHT